MADLNITLEEFDAVRNERDTYKARIDELNNIIVGLKNKSIGAVTRYDRKIPESFLDGWIDDLCIEVTRRIESSRQSFYDPFGGSFSHDTLSEADVIKQAIRDKVRPFIIKRCNTEDRSNINVSTQFVGVEEIVEAVKKVWDAKYEKEYGDKEREISTRMTEAVNTQHRAEMKLADANKKYNDAAKRVSRELEELKIQLQAYKSDAANMSSKIDTLTKSIDTYKSEKVYAEQEEQGLKDTVYNQQQKINIIKQLTNTWWFKLFGPKIEF